MSGFSGVAPTAILQQALSSFEVGAEDAGSQGQAFIASKSWQGPRPGYYFGKGSHGVGYYRDAARSAREPAQETADEEEADGPAGPSTSRRLLTAEELLEEAEAAAAADGTTGVLEAVDTRGLRRLLAALERKATHNLEQRTRYADNPERFLESEVELDEAINALRVVASTPELYSELAASSFPGTAALLLAHDNADVAASAVELLGELMAEDAAGEEPEAGAALAKALSSNGVPAALVARLKSFDLAVPEEAAAAAAALGVLGATLECDPSQAGVLAGLPGLLAQLLAALKPDPSSKSGKKPAPLPGNMAAADADSVREAAGELLGMLVQESVEAKRQVIEAGGVDALLQALAPLRRAPPADGDEAEHLETLFTALCSLLMLPAGQSAFLEGEGIELMELILKGKHGLRCATLRCLDFATTRSPSACRRLVEAGGLRHLFGVFMGKLKRAKGVDESEQQEEEERVVSIITSLFQLLPDSPARDRVASKFVEAEFEKVDRLMEILLRYHDRVAAGQARLVQAAASGEVDEDDLLLAQMDAGLYTLQQSAMIVGSLWEIGTPLLRKRVLMLLHQRSKSLAVVREALLGRRAALGADGPAEEAQRQQAAITGMLRALGHKEEDGDGEGTATAVPSAEWAVVAAGDEADTGKVAGEEKDTAFSFGIPAPASFEAGGPLP